MLNTLKFIWNHPLSSQARLPAYGRWLRWQFASRLLKTPVIWPWIGDTCLVAESGMTGATGNIYCGLHEFSDMAFVLHFLRKEDVFMDIGANIGSYTILASGVVGCATHAFEPHPATFVRLERNMRVNAIQDRVRLHRAAVGKTKGIVRFSAGLDTANHVLADADTTPAIEVPVLCIDDLDPRPRATLWKLDVEGYEEQVFEGAAQSLADPNLRAILTETETPRILQLLRVNNFQPVSYDPFRRAFSPPAPGKPRHNALWTRDPEFCAERVSTAAHLVLHGVRF